MDIKQEGKKKTWKRNQTCHSPGFRSEPLQWGGDFLALSGSPHQEERMVLEVASGSISQIKNQNPTEKESKKERQKHLPLMGKKNHASYHDPI